MGREAWTESLNHSADTFFCVIDRKKRKNAPEIVKKVFLIVSHFSQKSNQNNKSSNNYVKIVSVIKKSAQKFEVHERNKSNKFLMKTQAMSYQ